LSWRFRETGSLVLWPRQPHPHPLGEKTQLATTAEQHQPVNFAADEPIALFEIECVSD
jgi:hypothetical protein